jgi:hypothetical protein
MIKQILLFMILILGVAPLFAQNNKKILVDADGNLINTPEMEEIVRKRQELLNNLDLYVLFSAQAKISNVLQKNNSIQIKKQGLKDIKFEFYMENKTQNPFDLIFNDGEARIRPELKLNGNIINYSKNKEKQLRNKDEHPAVYHVENITFLPAIRKALPDFTGIGDLQKWYDPLEVGFYELNFSYRFWKNKDGEQKTLSSQPIFLEILPD